MDFTFNKDYMTAADLKKCAEIVETVFEMIEQGKDEREIMGIIKQHKEIIDRNKRTAA